MTGRLSDESGFSLAEMMMTVMVMIVVLFALYNVFDMSLRVFSFGNNKVEAVENARLGLERIERELRGAYPYDKGNATSNTQLFDSVSSPTTLTFANDLSPEDRVINAATEKITYTLTGTTLRRSVGGGTAEAVIESVRLADDPATPVVEGSRMEYLKKSGANLVATNVESEVEVVRITVDVEVDPGVRDAATQTLTTDVDLRNRG